MKKIKAIWNPVNPEVTPSLYEKHVGDVLQKFESIPGYIASYFSPFINDVELRKALAKVQLKRITSEKPKWQGASGCEHQIDESFSTENEDVILLVECKHWKSAVDFSAFSTFLVRLIDIAANNEGTTVLGMIITPQGHVGRTGSRKEYKKNCIELVQQYFNQLGHHVIFLILTD